MMARIGKACLLGALAVLGGMALQCSSDRAIVGDGGLIDSWLADLGIAADRSAHDARRVDTAVDSIGPKADAADAAGGSGIKRVVFSGTMAAPSGGGPTLATHCVPLAMGDFPAATLWTKSTTSTSGKWWEQNQGVYLSMLDSQPGCLTIQNGTSNAMDYRLVVIY